MPLINKPIIKQIYREFRIPLICATIWTSYNIYASRSITTAIASFSASFFFCSWIIGQFLRIAKQQRVESDLNTVKENLVSLINKLEVKTTDLVSYITGGDSTCHLSGHATDQMVFLNVVVHVGNHPIYDVNARIVDLRIFERLMERENVTANDIFTNDINIKIGNLIPGTASGINIQLPVHGNAANFNIFYSARNGLFVQILRYKKVHNDWKCSSVVTRQGQSTPLYRHVDEGFPEDSPPAHETQGSSPISVTD
ncbi:hypothetical protein [Cupriavidus taiwanensis]|uniref:Uncharacterized protein n=1 Tax=Cupriavidus taiwanensis TaxID=164546 RepID=A0A375IWI4_9BURK|nr:hypothetical protein [Cupriavidus taiwanensis]SPR97334.1 conserved hypothetical protein [Cupriavidus taiwanensis]